VLEQPHGVARVHVLGEDEHADARVVAANALAGDEPFVRVRRRHLDVDDGDVRLLNGDAVEKLVAVRRGCDHVEPPRRQQAAHALADENRVVGDRDAERPLGRAGRGQARRENLVEALAAVETLERVLAGIPQRHFRRRFVAE
jgi:hypothetical protein